TRDPPARAREDLRVEVAVRRPVGGVGKELRQLPQLADGVDERHELDGPDYHLTRSGGGSPCASCQPITGFRRKPILSISASITAPGFRKSDAASSEKPATPETVPVESTSP